MLDTLLEDLTINLFPTSHTKGLYIAAHGAKMIFMEAEDSTVLLDMDETMIHVIKLTPEILEFFQKNPDSQNIPALKTNLKSNEIAPWAKENIKQIQKTLSQYKYKTFIKIIPHEQYGYGLIIFRPHIKEFIDGLQELITKHDLQDLKVFTANKQDYAQVLVDNVNEHVGQNLELYNPSQPLKPSSMIVDDNKPLAGGKLVRAQIIDKKDIMSDNTQHLVHVPAFRGDLNDKALLQALEDVKERV